MRYPSVVAIFTLAAVGYYPAWALDVVGFNAATNSRFSSGFPSAPVSNPSGSFIGAGFDFSGVGWEAASPDFAVTMISPQNFVTAAHVAPGASSTVDFFSQDGVLRPYTVASTSSILYNGQTSDLVVGTLSTAIPASDHVAYYPILYIGTPLSTINLSGYTVPTLLVYGKTGTIGTNTIDGFVNGDLNNNGIVESLWFYTDFDAVTGQTQGQSGDSGSPTFALVNGTLTLVGVHSAIGTVPPNPNPATFDNFLAWPSILLQVSDVTVASGQSVTLYVSSIPEPAAVSAVLGISALVVTAGCRKKRPVAKTGTPNRTT